MTNKVLIVDAMNTFIRNYVMDPSIGADGFPIGGTRGFLKTLQKLIPSLEMKDIRPGRAGVRALLLGKDGDTRDDFRIEYGNNSIHVLNAPSPAATAAMAIGNDIKKMAVERFNVN